MLAAVGKEDGSPLGLLRPGRVSACSSGSLTVDAPAKWLEGGRQIHPPADLHSGAVTSSWPGSSNLDPSIEVARSAREAPPSLGTVHQAVA